MRAAIFFPQQPSIRYTVTIGNRYRTSLANYNSLNDFTVLSHSNYLSRVEFTKCQFVNVCGPEPYTTSKQHYARDN